MTFFDNPKLPMLNKAKNVERIYIRECYKVIYDQLMLALADEDAIIVTGNPGIGKSMFRSYIYHRLKNEGNRPYDYIVCNTTDKQELGVLVNVKGKVEEFEDYSDFKNNDSIKKLKLRKNPNCLFLLDGCNNTSVYPEAKMIVFTSPEPVASSDKKSSEKQLLKSGVPKYIMPVWSLTEILEAVEGFTEHFEKDELKKRYDIVGGIPRYIFYTDEAFDTIVKDIEAKIQLWAKPIHVSEFVDSIELNNLEVVTHKLIHTHPNEMSGTKINATGKRVVYQPYKTYIHKFASPYLMIRFFNKMNELQNQSSSILDNIDCVAARGFVYEQLVHWLFCEAFPECEMKFTCKLIPNEGESEEEIELHFTGKQRKYFMNIEDIQKVETNMYYQPSTWNFRAIDSFTDGNFFQMTVAKEHTFDESVTDEYAKKLKFEDDYKVIWISPPNVNTKIVFSKGSKRKHYLLELDVETTKCEMVQQAIKNSITQPDPMTSRKRKRNE